MLQNYIKYNAKTSSKSTQDCSPLLCYRFVTTTLTAQIPNGNAIAKPPALLHSTLLYYTTLATQISSGNAIAKTT